VQVASTVAQTAAVGQLERRPAGIGPGPGDADAAQQRAAFDPC